MDVQKNHIPSYIGSNRPQESHIAPYILVRFLVFVFWGSTEHCVSLHIHLHNPCASTCVQPPATIQACARGDKSGY